MHLSLPIRVSSHHKGQRKLPYVSLSVTGMRMRGDESRWRSRGAFITNGNRHPLPDKTGYGGQRERERWVEVEVAEIEKEHDRRQNDMWSAAAASRFMTPTRIWEANNSCARPTNTIHHYTAVRDGKEPKILRFGFGSDSSSTELETCFRGGYLLRINWNCKYQLIDWRQRS